MEVTFEIEYRTEWGQRLVWCGDGRRIPMEYLPDGVWRCCVTLGAGVVEYGYEAEADGRTIRSEWRLHRQTVAPEGAERLTVCDRWLDRPADSPFYASAFTRAIFARPSRKRGAQTVCGGVELQVEAPAVRPDETLAVAGSSAELGGWERFAELDDRDFPRWRIRLEGAEPFEYKFVRLDRRTRRPVAWEEGPNRRCDRVPTAGERIVVAGLRPDIASETAWRGAGTALPLFSLRTESDFGTGEFPDLRKLIDWAAATGQRVIQLLPVNDTIRTGTRRDSYPYNAVSSFALHPLYLSLTAAGLQPDGRYRRQQQRLNALPEVDYEAVMRLKLRWAERLYRQTGQRIRATDDYAAFCAQNRSWLEPYAAFSVLRDRFGTADHRQWGDYARYDEQRLCTFRYNNREAIDFYYFLQYHLHLQLSDASRYARRCGVVLKGDIPIGVSPSSVDVWQHPQLFHLGAQAGAPPDAFAAMGQNWGFPTYDWQAMERDDYGWWRARLRQMAEYFDAYRIDHILGFFRIWEIPADAVHGLLGYFRPALPYSREELEAEGFRLPDVRYTRPQATDAVLRELFGRAAAEVKGRFVVDGGLRTEVSTQAAVRRLFDKVPDRRQRRIRDGLLRLLDDVLFIEDADRPGHYHPAIAGQATVAYRLLEPEQRQAFDRLHEEFFYRRHNACWREEALRKLPALLDATAMLACGEDLGMIPACVPEVMERLHILTLEIERMPKAFGATFGDPQRYPYLSVGTTSTHDMAPLRCWWHENPALTQRYYTEALGRRGRAPQECSPALCRKIVGRTLAGRSMLAILPLQDWLATDVRLRRDDPDAERINVPADPKHYWRYRMHLTMEELLASGEFNRSLKRMLRAAGRIR